MVDPILLLQQTVNFLVLVFILQRFLYKPVRKFLDERTAMIEQQINSAREQEEEATKLRQELEVKLQDGRTQAKEYLDQAVRRSEQIHEELVEKAKAEAATIQKRTQEDINREKEKAWQELRENVIQLSFAIASKVVKESLDEKKHQALIQDAIANLEHQKLGDQQ